MNLKEQLFNDFGIDLPISGGIGNSVDNTIVIHKKIPNDYTSIEYGILRCLGIGRQIEWKVLRQAVMHHEGKTIDQLKIETKKFTETQIITQIENFYFDITECVNF